MNYLSHYYFDKDDKRPHYIFGLIFPDLMRTFNRGRVKEQIIKVDWGKPMQNLQEGINKHHRIDKLFHDSTFFKTSNKRFFKEVQALQLEGVTKYQHFVSHVLIEMILDRLLLLEDIQIGFTFYSKLNSIDKYFLNDYLTLFPYLYKDMHLENFWQFFRRFCDSQFLYDYQGNEGLIARLDEVMQRITKQAFTPHDRVKLNVFVDAMEEDLEKVYKEVFKELEVAY